MKAWHLVCVVAFFGFGQAYAGSFPHYTGEVLPTPHRIQTGDEWIALAGVDNPTAAIFVLNENRPAVQYGAKYLQAVARDRGFDLPILKSPLDALTRKILIIVGDEAMGSVLPANWDAKALPETNQPEGYYVRCFHYGASRIIAIRGGSHRGTAYGAFSLAQLFCVHKNSLSIRSVDIDDWPDFRWRIASTDTDFTLPIVGDYARWLAQYKMNCFATNYPLTDWKGSDEAYLNAWSELGKAAKETGALDLLQMVNPYQKQPAINIADDAQIATLEKTFRAVLDRGATSIMICADDFCETTTQEATYIISSQAERDKFETLAAAHAFMVNAIYDRLHRDYPDARMSFCPPYYSNYHVEKWAREQNGIDYLKEVGEKMNPDVGIVWTGPEVLSRNISSEDVDKWSSWTAGRPVFYWDNTIPMRHNPPCYVYDLMDVQWPEDFAQKCWNGSVYLNGYASELYRTAYVCFASLLWNSKDYDPERAFRNTIASLYGPENVDVISQFRNSYLAAVGDVASLSQDRPLEAGQLESLQASFDASLLPVRQALPKEEGLLAELNKVCEKSMSVPTRMAQIPCVTYSLTDSRPLEIDLGDDNGGQVQHNKTRVSFLVEENCLTATFLCEEEKMSELKRLIASRQPPSSLFGLDTAEFVIAPTSESYYHFAVNIAGSKLSQIRSQRGNEPIPVQNWEARIAFEDRVWALTVRVPWTLLGGRPTPGAVWRGNMNRQRLMGGPGSKELSSWASCYGQANSPQYFGFIKF